MDKMLVLQASLFTLIGGLTPIGAVLSGSQPLNGRLLTGAIVMGLIGAAAGLKGFLSTTFADSPSSRPSKPSV